MGWPPGNVSLQVFHSEADSVVLSLSLRDAFGVELLQQSEVHIGVEPPPLNSSQAVSAPPASGTLSVPTLTFDFNPADHANTMALTALVTLNGAEQTSGTLTAVVGTQVRGVQSTLSTPPFGHYAGKPMFQLVVYADSSGDALRFEFHVDGEVWQLAETMSFSINGNVGDVLEPLMLTGAFAARDEDDEDDEDNGEADDESTSSAGRALTAQPPRRLLLKGGTSGFSGYGGRTTSYGSSTGYRGTSSVSAWGSRGAMPMRTRYGYSAPRVVMAGTVIYLMHRRGYGGQCAGVHGCQAAADEALSRDVILPSFPVDAGKPESWPLTLTLNISVSRAGEGSPSVYISFFAEEGAEEEGRGSLSSILFVPFVVLCCVCSLRLCCREPSPRSFRSQQPMIYEHRSHYPQEVS